jgi:16S rRNA (guanine527-N7)-methyltransferase
MPSYVKNCLFVGQEAVFEHLAGLFEQHLLVVVSRRVVSQYELSGAGLPGVPLAILMPEQAICLLEANSRRCDFLRSVLERLALPHASVLESRAETAGQDPRWRERFDITVSRAVAALPELLEYMLPLTRPGGRALCWKGRKAQEELTAARPAAQKLGDARLTLLPFGAEQDSCLIIADKQGPTPAQYPRRNGIPHKRPIL